MIAPLEVPRNEAGRKGKAAPGRGPQRAAKDIKKAGARKLRPGVLDLEELQYEQHHHDYYHNDYHCASHP
jgi:hypothetical protein